MEIRAATAFEAPGIAALLATAGHVIDPRDLAERLSALRDASAMALVALQWGPPSGLVVLHWYRTLHAARPISQITTLLVSEDERRRGIGRMLLKAAAQAARMAGCGDMQIAVPQDTPSLQAFCRETGFTEIGPVFVRSLRKQAYT